MNESPLRFLDYDVSLLLNEYVEKEIKKQSRIYHIKNLNDINNIILDKLNTKNINHKCIIYNFFDKNDIVVANTIYYKTILNKIIHICSYGIVEVSESYIDNFFFTILNLWHDIPDYYDKNLFIPIIHSKLIHLINKGNIYYHEKFINDLINSINILNNSMGIDKYQNILFHHGIKKPFSITRYHKKFFKEWCNNYFYQFNRYENKHIYKLILEIINDEYFPNSNDYMIHYHYIKKKEYCHTIFNDKLYYFNKLWYDSGREIGYIYHYNSVKKFELFDDYRYIMINKQKNLKEVLDPNLN